MAEETRGNGPFRILFWDQRPRGEVERKAGASRIDSTAKAIRTYATETAKWVASPAATPPNIRPSTARCRRSDPAPSVWFIVLFMTQFLSLGEREGRFRRRRASPRSP